MSDFEVEDNIVCAVILTKLRKNVEGDKFKLQKEFMIELEEISDQESNFLNGQMCAKAKMLIVENMLDQN